jgi:hypothetical protein
MILYGLAGVPVISCSRGIVSELPYVNPKEVIEKQGLGFDNLLRKPAESYAIAQEYLHYRGLYILKTDFWIETVNIQTKKGLQRLLYLLRWYWYKGKPWKWLGGKGYLPLKMRRMRWLEKKKARIQKKLDAAKIQTPVTGASI